MKNTKQVLSIGLLAAGISLSACSGTVGGTSIESIGETPEESPDTTLIESEATIAIEALQALDSVAIEGTAVTEEGTYSVLSAYTAGYFYQRAECLESAIDEMDEEADPDGGEESGQASDVIGSGLVDFDFDPGSGEEESKPEATTTLYENYEGYLAIRSGLNRDNTVAYEALTDEEGEPIPYYGNPFEALSEENASYEDSVLAFDAAGMEVLLDLILPEALQDEVSSITIEFGEGYVPLSIAASGEELAYVGIFIEESSVLETIDWGIKPYGDEEGQDGVGEILKALQEATSYSVSYEGANYTMEVVYGKGVVVRDSVQQTPYACLGFLQDGDYCVPFMSDPSDDSLVYSDPIEGDAVDIYFETYGAGVTPDFGVAQQFFDVVDDDSLLAPERAYVTKVEFGTEFHKWLVPLCRFYLDYLFLSVDHDFCDYKPMGNGDLAIAGTVENPKMAFLYGTSDSYFSLTAQFSALNETELSVSLPSEA